MAQQKAKSTGVEARPHWISIAIGTGAIAATLGAVAIQRSCDNQSPNKLSFVTFADNANGSVVPDAEVNLNIPEVVPQYTDSKGQTTFLLPKSSIGSQSKISVRKAGFENYSQQILVQPRPDYYQIYLQSKTSTPSNPDTNQSSAN